MTSLIQEGIGLGLILSLAVGPILFMLIQITIEKGFWAGIVFSIGVWSSDFFYVALVYLGVTPFADSPAFKLYMGIGGGILLSLFGIAMLLTKVKLKSPGKLNLKSYGAAFLKGVAINVFNPFCIVSLDWSDRHHDRTKHGLPANVDLLLLHHRNSCYLRCFESFVGRKNQE